MARKLSCGREAFFASLLVLLLPGCAPREAQGPRDAALAQPQMQALAAIAFADVTQEAGLRFRHVNGADGRFYYPETFGGGAAFLDYDRDGWLDILLVNGDFWPGRKPQGTPRPTLALYRNQGDGKFAEATEEAGLKRSLYGMGVAVGDYDNDGFDDLYITALDRSLLLRNVSAGGTEASGQKRKFVDVSREAGVTNDGHWGTSAAWIDYDNDGNLDLFVCNYIRWRPEEEKVCRQGDLRVYCGPLIYPADSCRLYRNLGDGRFRDESRRAGIASAQGKALGVAVWDVDGDRYPEILVANDLSPNHLFRNNRDGTFQEIGLESGVAYGGDGVARSGMGIDVADTRNDGKCAVFISNFAREPNSLFCQEEPRVFTDCSYETGMGEPSLLALGFGLFFFDYDNDGWKDAFVTNGHIQPEIARYEPGQAYAQPPLLFRNRGDGSFEEIHEQAGKGMQETLVGRGAACGDYDNDGDPDILHTGINGPARLLRNDGGNRDSWLNIRLTGRGSARSGIGAEVRVKVGDKLLRDQVRSGSSYLSASDLRLHFGLGKAAQADWVEVRWPGGTVDRIADVRANQFLVIEEGRSAPQKGRAESGRRGAGGFLASLFLGAILLCAVAARGADGPEERHQSVLRFLKQTAADISARSLTEFQSREDWQRERPALRRRLLSMLGLEPLPKRAPLQARITGSLQRPGYRIEKIVFQSLPGLYVTGNLYLPEPRSGPLPTILYVCGHSPHPLGAKWDYQDRALWFVENGYACFVLDTLEFGEVPGLHHGIHDLNMFHWLSLGYTPAGVEVWNAMRALDYLETRPEVDAKRIGMTGISGGGATTWFTAAVEDRIAAAAPVCSTYTFGSQAAHWVAAGQCDCIYFHNTYLMDFPAVAALIAPRPLLICSGQRDGDFPPDGYHEVYRRARRIYDFYERPAGEPERIKEVDENVGHSDSPLLLAEARRWMHRWLKGEDAPTATETPQPRETAEDLACLARLPEDAVNYKIHDRFIAAAVGRKPKPRSPEQWEQRRRELVQGLREQVFRWFPREEIPFASKVGGSDGGWAAKYADYKEAFFESEAGVPLRVQLLRPRKASAQAPLLIYVKRPGDSIYFLDLDELLPLLGRYSVLILNPRLTERAVSAFENAEIERTASWVGRTVAAMQVWDILRAVEWAHREEGLSPSSVSLYGKGEMGVLALYAGLFDARIGQVILANPPVSHRQGPALLNILRVSDIPEIAGAFAPRKIVFLGTPALAFEQTRSLYKLQGSPGSLMQADSLPEALEIWKVAWGP